MGDKSPERGYRIEQNTDDQRWPVQLMINDQMVAQFSGENLARAVCRSLNSEFYPSRTLKIMDWLSTGGFSSLSRRTPPHELDMPQGA